MPWKREIIYCHVTKSAEVGDVFASVLIKYRHYMAELGKRMEYLVPGLY